MTPSLALSQKRDDRWNICGPAAAGEIPCSKQVAFMYLEKAVDHVSWWALRKLDVDEWKVRLICRWLQPRVWQGSLLSPMLFTIVLEEALSREFCFGAPLEDMYADSFVNIAD